MEKWTPANRGYFAGLLDGEGVISYCKGGGKGPTFRVSIKMTDNQAIEELATFYGKKLALSRSKNLRHKDTARINLQGACMLDFLRQVFPHLRIKQRQANLVLKCDMSSPTSRRYVMDRLRELNQRGPLSVVMLAA